MVKAVKNHPLKGWKLDIMNLHWEGKYSYQQIADWVDRPYDTVYGVIQRYKDVERPTKEVDEPTIFVIGDTQVKQGIALDYIHWIGKYIATQRPDIIVMIGDWFDMASLSSYDKGQLSAEGRRFYKDIEAGNEAIRILESYISAAEGYNPRKVITLGNHEDRIDRFVSTHPEFEGFIGTDKLAFKDYGWEVYPFLTPCIICGISFVHYVPNVNTGKPLGGAILTRLKTVGESFIMGHQQTMEHTLRYLQLSGKAQVAGIVGACYEHDEAYKGVQGNRHFRGCFMIYECNDGFGLIKPVSLRHMRKHYNSGV